MLFGMLGAFGRGRGRQAVITLDKRSSGTRGDAVIVKRAEEARIRLLRTGHGVSGSPMMRKEETIDDYVKEAELLFRVRRRQSCRRVLDRYWARRKRCRRRFEKLQVEMVSRTVESQ